VHLTQRNRRKQSPRGLLIVNHLPCLPHFPIKHYLMNQQKNQIEYLNALVSSRHCLN
jgi:hypothetical protein